MHPICRRDLGTRVQDSVVVSKYLSPKPERHMGRSLQRYISDGLRTLQRCNPQGAPRASFPASHPQTVRDSRILLQISTSQTEKTSPKSTRPYMAKSCFALHDAGALGGSFLSFWGCRVFLRGAAVARFGRAGCVGRVYAFCKCRLIPPHQSLSRQLPPKGKPFFKILFTPQ